MTCEIHSLVDTESAEIIGIWSTDGMSFSEKVKFIPYTKVLMCGCGNGSLKACIYVPLDLVGRKFRVTLEEIT